MSGENDCERAIARSWRANADAWVRAVREGNIESRRRVTDRAILDAVTDGGPASVLDVGCGEGWLVRSLDALGIDARGIDFTEALVESARQAGGRFDVLSYAALADWPQAGPFDALVCNFSLIGEASTRDVFRAVPHLLAPAGRFVVQTLHPAGAGDAPPGTDGWREGSWAGFPDGFRDPAPWYFRTPDAWQRLFDDHHLELAEVREPRDRVSGAPASLIFISALR